MNTINISQISATMTVEEYLVEREWSNLPVLIVEGDDDSIFFQLLKDEMIQHKPQSTEFLSKLQIDTPDFIKSPEGKSLGHREKVELICLSATDAGFQGKLIGFVDREFRSFHINSLLLDKLNRQRKIGRLIWSRGHSIENYFFEFPILRRGLRDYAINRYFDVNEALNVFEENFDSTLQIACTLSLVALKLKLTQLVKNSLDWQHFKLDNNKIKFDLRLWSNHLRKKHNLDENRTQSLIESFTNWYDVATKAESEVVRWLCHGHIGEVSLWSAYGACIYEICLRNSIPEPDKKVRKIAKRDRFTTFVTSWTQKYLEEDTQDTPFECFALLNI